MVERIGKGGALAREALLAALRSASERAGSGAPAATAESASARGADFTHALEQGVARVDESVRTATEMPEALLSGRVADFHEIAVQLKSAELSFRFALEIRNKLIDAYREIMRMSV